MYCILMDKNTKSFYMKPRELCFYAFSSPERYDMHNENTRLIETEYSDLKEFTTMLFNAGFLYGYIDHQEIRIGKSNSYYLDKNINEVAYAQYLICHDEKYLELIKKKKLLSICKIEGDSILFPTVTLDNGMSAVLSYTDRVRIPQVLFDKYPDYRVVRMTFNIPCLVNGKFVVD